MDLPSAALRVHVKSHERFVCIKIRIMHVSCLARLLGVFIVLVLESQGIFYANIDILPQEWRVFEGLANGLQMLGQTMSVRKEKKKNVASFKRDDKDETIDSVA